MSRTMPPSAHSMRASPRNDLGIAQDDEPAGKAGGLHAGSGDVADGVGEFGMAADDEVRHAVERGEALGDERLDLGGGLRGRCRPPASLRAMETARFIDSATVLLVGLIERGGHGGGAVGEGFGGGGELAWRPGRWRCARPRSCPRS